MFIYSGNVRKGKCGEPTKLEDRNGKSLFIGDIVALFHTNKSYPEDIQTSNFENLTAIVDDKYISYSDGTHVESDEESQPFVMGIKDTDIMHEKSEWSVELVKSYIEAVDGEHWKNYGFNYKKD
jgi:hypothetical protein